MQNDWSQFVPDIISGLIVAFSVWLLTGGLSAWISKRIRNKKLFNILLFFVFLLILFVFVGYTLSGAPQMNSRQLTLSIGYFLLSFIVMMVIYMFFVLPLIKRNDISQETKPPTIASTLTAVVVTQDSVPELAFSNTQISVTSSGDVILRTVISSMTEGNRKPVNILLPSNFSITEQFNKSVKKANIYQAMPSSTRADIIVLIDTSGSMAEQTDILDENRKYLTKLEVVKKAVKLFFEDLSASEISTVDGKPSRIAFLPFSTQGVNFLESADGDIWFSTTPGSNSEVIRSIDALIAQGDTPLYDAVSHALDILRGSEEDSYKIIFCLTDGKNNHSSIYYQTLQQELQSDTIPVITVGYGKEGEYDGGILQDMAFISGAGQPGVGSFINVMPNDLSSVFTRLSTDLNNIYEIRWKSAFPKPGNLVTATITVNYEITSGRVVSAKETRTYLVPLAGR